MGKTFSESSIGSSGQGGGTRPGQTCKKPKYLSVCDGEERGCGEGGGVYDVWIGELKRVQISGCRCNERLKARVCDLEGIGVSSIFRLIRSSAAFSRMCPTLPLSCEENSCGESGSWFAIKACYRSMGTTDDPVPVGQRSVPVNHFTG